jgi:hypothetical protein
MVDPKKECRFFGLGSAGLRLAVACAGIAEGVGPYPKLGGLESGGGGERTELDGLPPSSSNWP